MDQMPLIPDKPFDVFDVRSKFVSCIKISPKKLNDFLKLDEEKKLSGKFDILDVSLSNMEISFSSLVNFSSAQEQIKVLVPTNEPISFGVGRKTLRKGLWMMAVGKEVNRIYLAYQPEEEKKLILADAQGQVYLETVPCTQKEISESPLHLKLNNSSGC
ncbi:hypothetical protein MKW92_013228 [Papaver armeniacum]|nr:hypothetical protein MKW92_013228 [Papaver armeniacum]